MGTLSRVVWSEGMHIAQHHFQAQNRYFEGVTAFSVSALSAYPWGLAGCELDTEALLNGTASVVHARGVMPDGLAFQFPEDAAPAPLDVASRFPPTESSRLLLLGIPAYRPERSNCAIEASPNGTEHRFLPVREELPDETTGTDARAVTFARKNFKLLLEDEAADGLVVLPLARIRRDGAGHFVYDAEYIPPSLRIGASPALLSLLARLVDILDAKAESMAAERRDATADRADYAAREVANFWLSHAVHSTLAPLRHQLRARAAHPERLYAELARLAGALCTFSLEAHPRDLPAYDHERPELAFHALDAHIRRHLEIVRPTNRVVLKLHPTEQFFHTTEVPDRRCFGRAHWFLGVRSDAPQAEVISRVPKLVKICSAKHIVRLVKEAFPGLGLAHAPSPPRALSPRVGSLYFPIERTEPCWRTIVDSSQVGVYAPAALGNLELEILVLLEE